MKPRKPRILLVGKRPPDFGGVSAVSELILTSERILQQYEIVVLSTTHASVHVETEKRRIRLAYIGRRLRLLFRLVFLVFTKRPYLVHYHTGGDLAFLSDFLNLLILKLFCRRVILHYHTNPQHELTVFPSETRNGIATDLFRYAINRSDLFLVLGNQYRDYIRSIPDVQGDKVQCLYNSIPKSFVVTRASGQKLHAAKKLQVLFLGRLSEQKGFFDVLLIAERCREEGLEADFLVAGTANSMEDEKRVQELVKLKSLSNVRLFGQVLGELKTKLLADADLLLFPSRYEGFPVSIIEAAAYGVASVVYDVGMMREIVVDGETGRVLRPHAVDEMFAAIREVGFDRSECRRLGEGARRRFLTLFSPEQFESQLTKYYKGL